METLVPIPAVILRNLCTVVPVFRQTIQRGIDELLLFVAEHVLPHVRDPFSEMSWSHYIADGRLNSATGPPVAPAAPN